MSHIPEIPEGVVLGTVLPPKNNAYQTPKLLLSYTDENGRIFGRSAQLSVRERFNSAVYDAFVLRGMVRDLTLEVNSSELHQFNQEIHDWDI